MIKVYHNDKSEFSSYLRSLIEKELTDIRVEEDISVIIGGDGFFFKMINKLPKGTIFLPLNGGTLGYTLNDVDLDNLGYLINLIRERNWKEYLFPILSVFYKVKNSNREIFLDKGANDIYIERSSGQTARLLFKVDETDMLQEPVICDGLIVSTPLGSTAYSLSAGGPILHPALKSIGLTFSNPHAPRIPPMIIPGNSTITIRAIDYSWRPVRIVCDGREIDWKSKTTRLTLEDIVIRYSKETVKVLYLNGHCRTKQLSKKIIRR